MRRIVGFSSLDRDRLPSRCAGCMYWATPHRLPFECGALCDTPAAAEWTRTVASEWGECGKVVLEDGEILGFITYAPPVYLPQAAQLPTGPALADTVLIACMHIAPDARRYGVGGLLLRAAMRDLALRGERGAQAFATTARGDMSHVPVVGVEFLLRHGFTVERPHPELPLLRVDLKALTAWSDNLEAVLESLRIPVRAPRRAPATLSRGSR